MIEQVVELGRRGATDFEIAKELGISVSTLNSWKQSNVAFLESLKVGKQIADSRVQESLYNRAVGFTAPDGTYHPPHPVAGIFWLKNRRPDEWRDTTRTELTGKDGGALELQASPRPSPEEVCNFSREAHEAFAAYRGEKGEAALLGAREIASLAEAVASYAAAAEHGYATARLCGETIAQVNCIHRQIREEIAHKNFPS